jgi:hypothetical protein
VRVFGVADGDDAGEVAGDFHAVPAVAAPAGLAPLGAAQVYDFATSSINSKDAATGRATDLIVPNSIMREARSAAPSTICPWTAVSWYATGG